MSALLVAAIVFPLLLAPALASRWTRPAAQLLAPLGPLPALVLAATAPPATHLELPWLLLGSVFGLDEVGRPFLFATAFVWLVAGLYAVAYLRDDPRRAAFTAFFLLTQAGNLALCLALDGVSFYLGFALMSFSAYGLVIHTGTDQARRAARIYLAMVVLGEALLLAGFLLAVAAGGGHLLVELAADLATAPARDTAAALLLLGFGIKVGVPLLHLWLPLAHPVAPVPASAVLSGVIIKAGLLGWLRFLPLGAAELPALGAATMTAGLAGVFYGVAVGLTQRDAKAVLAYSSISQMGFMTVGVGAGLLAPQLWPALLPAVILYALHHAAAKSALFLGVGVVRAHGASPAILLGLALPALALAGAPWSAGALAKTALKLALQELPAPWPQALAALLPLGALGTALLMAHVVALVARQAPQGKSRGLVPAWVASLGAVAGLAGWMGAMGVARADPLEAAWPLAAAALFAAVAWRRRWQAPELPPGDLIVPVERLIAAVARRARLPRMPPAPARRGAHAAWLRTEAALGQWTLAAALWLVVLAVLAAVLLM